MIEKPVVRHDLGAAEIARLPGAIRDSRIQGLTLIRRSMSVGQTYSTESGAGVLLAWLDDVEVTLSLTPIEIYIPKEYPEGSCEYEALMDHEGGHVDVGSEAAAAAARNFERAFSRAPELPSKERPLVANRRGEVVAALKREVDDLLDPVYERFEQDLARLQAERDQPAGYDYLFKRCSGWR